MHAPRRLPTTTSNTRAVLHPAHSSRGRSSTQPPQAVGHHQSLRRHRQHQLTSTRRSSFSLRTNAKKENQSILPMHMPQNTVRACRYSMYPPLKTLGGHVTLTPTPPHCRPPFYGESNCYTLDLATHDFPSVSSPIAVDRHM